MKRYIYKFSIVALFISSSGMQLMAQSRPVIAQYFQNPYFVNPAYAGKDGGFSLNMDYSFKNNNNQGNLKNQFLTADVNLKKSGLGFIVQNQENGLLSIKVVKLTYAHHLKLADKVRMHFGLSSGLTQERFDFDQFINNDMNDNSDPLPAEFNSRNASFNVDFGTAITADKFSIQMSVTNLRKVIVNNTNISDRVWYTAATYKLISNQMVQIEPVVAFTRNENLNDRVDAGMRLHILNEQVSLLGLYRSDDVFSTAMALKLSQGIFIQGAYNAAFSNNNLINNGVFEVAIKANFKGANK